MNRNIRIDKLKIKNKNYAQSNKVNIAQIKKNSKESFQKLLDDNEEFDSYISNSFTTKMKIIIECFNNNHKIQI